MNKTYAAAWDEVAEFAERHEDAALVREGHRFTYRFTVPAGRVDVWAEENTPRFGGSVHVEGEEWPVSFRCWTVEALATLVAGLG